MSKSDTSPPAVEVLSLHLLEPGARWLAVAVVRVGPVVIRHVRVIERDGQLKVRLPGVSIDQPVILALAAAVLEEFRGGGGSDLWADLNSVPPTTRHNALHLFLYREIRKRPGCRWSG